MNPLKIRIMDVDEFVAAKDILQVSSSFIKESSTGNFDQNGLFSESIFGEIASTERISRHGYIELNTKIIHPKLYDIVIKFKSFYKDIITGVAHAVFDTTINDFVRADIDTPGAGTGYSFFVKQLPKLTPELNKAIRHDNRVNVFLQNKDRLFITKLIVIPAGLREYHDKNGRGEYDDVNKLYMSVINLARAISDKDSDNPIFDPVMNALQRKVNEIYAYIFDIMDDKKGYLQGKYAARAIALGTRNVISATDMTASTVKDAALLKSDEVLIPLFQVLNMLKPIIIYNLKNIFFNQVFNRDTVQASLIDPKTLLLGYHTIPLSEKTRFTTAEKISDMINNFRDDTVKHFPVVAYDTDGKEFYLYITYRSGNNVYMARSIQDLEILVKSGMVKSIDRNNVKPLTYFEMFYIAASAMQSKYTTITRFPVTGAGSIFPAKIHIATTSNYDTVNFVAVSNTSVSMILDRYPITDANAIGSVSTHPSQLVPLDADHDGDTITCLGIMSEEAVKECETYLNSPASIVSTNGRMTVGLSTKLCKLTLYNLTRELV